MYTEEAEPVMVQCDMCDGTGKVYEAIGIRPRTPFTGAMIVRELGWSRRSHASNTRV